MEIFVSVIRQEKGLGAGPGKLPLLILVKGKLEDKIMKLQTYLAWAARAANLAANLAEV